MNTLNLYPFYRQKKRSDYAINDGNLDDLLSKSFFAGFETFFDKSKAQSHCQTDQ